jgi:hypothetical protein
VSAFEVGLDLLLHGREAAGLRGVVGAASRSHPYSSDDQQPEHGAYVFVDSYRSGDGDAQPPAGAGEHAGSGQDEQRRDERCEKEVPAERPHAGTAAPSAGAGV